MLEAVSARSREGGAQLARDREPPLAAVRQRAQLDHVR